MSTDRIGKKVGRSGLFSEKTADFRPKPPCPKIRWWIFGGKTLDLDAENGYDAALFE